MSNNKYTVMVDGKEIAVSKELYEYLKKSDQQTDYIDKCRRREKRYRRNKKTGETYTLPGIEDSLDRYRLDDIRFADKEDFGDKMVNKLFANYLMSKLTESEEYVIRQLYIVGLTERELAKTMNISQNKLHKTKAKTLAKLHNFL